MKSNEASEAAAALGRPSWEKRSQGKTKKQISKDMTKLSQLAATKRSCGEGGA